MKKITFKINCKDSSRKWTEEKKGWLIEVDGLKFGVNKVFNWNITELSTGMYFGCNSETLKGCTEKIKETIKDIGLDKVKEVIAYALRADLNGQPLNNF